MTKEQLFRYFFAGVFIFLGYHLLRILSPFYTGILGAIVMNIIFHPLHIRVMRRMENKRPSVSAFISTLLVVLVIVVPCAVFGPKGEGLHTDKEWLDIRSIRPFYDILKKFVEVDLPKIQ